MKRLKTFLALLACIVLFAGAVVFSLYFSQEEETAENANPIILSEILASNITYPAPGGKYLDFVEVHNTTDSPLDISGYMLSDDGQSIGYTFPNGTIIQAHGYIVCWCDKESESGNYAAFGIAKRGGDIVCLYNSANVMVDRYEVPRTNDNVPLIRLEDGSWTTGSQATPGYENTDAGYEAWLASSGGGITGVVISEIMSGSNYSIIDGEGHQSDWIELWNRSANAVTLDGCYLSDDPGDRTKWTIEDLTLQSGERIVIRCAGAAATVGEADFALPRSGCTVILTGSMGNTIDLVEVPELGKDCAWAMTDDETYTETALPTPGYENTDAGYAAWLSAVGYVAPEVVISEVVTANRSTITNEAGRLCDWVELYNPTSSAVELERVYLSNDPADRMKWPIPATTLEAGERMVICCSGSGAPEGEADFSLNRDGITLILSGAVGNVIDQVEVPRMGEDRAWALQSDGTYEESPYPSPGFANTEDGYQAFRATQYPASDLIISEVMPSNCSYLVQSDGEYYDWLELKNISGASVDLTHYALSDDPDSPDKFRLPDVTLEAGETIVIICSGYTELTDSRYTHAPFTLSREESWVYLSHISDNSCCDYLRIYDVPYQHSVGRVDGENGTFYFTTPTPGTENGSGVAFISETPIVETADGVFNDVGSITVTLNGEGPLYYTTDGSVPTSSSQRYTSPIVLDSTTVIRVVSLEEGKLPSDVVTASYIINENHTLPVISISADPDELFGSTGIYTQYRADREIQCNLKLFEDGEGFTIDCGLKLYGHTGLINPKKSFKVNFRGRYGASTLNYPVWGDEGPYVYDSLCIRAGQDYPKSIFRDELFTSLCREFSDKALAQRDKFCILYVNGEYFGIYCMKEAWTELMYAQNMGGSPENVEIIQAPVGMDSEIYALNKYCRTHDQKTDEYYNYLDSQIDLDSLIDWMIMEGYCTNSDVQQNLRYFRSTDTGYKWQYAFYDLDWTFNYHTTFRHIFSSDQTWQHMTITKNLIKNPIFRDKFLTRLAEAMETTLSNENVIARIEYYENLLDPEVERERNRWSSTYEAWKREVQALKDFVLEENHINYIPDKLKMYIGLTNAEAQKYFSRWD
ncbi:MAG: lamin tail domain-containing protein [Oscillospiraceae bacterium]|nr:lamin tail domain-containing protein [Oscillospiraceae bacterium]